MNSHWAATANRGHSSADSPCTQHLCEQIAPASGSSLPWIICFCFCYIPWYLRECVNVCTCWEKSKREMLKCEWRGVLSNLTQNGSEKETKSVCHLRKTYTTLISVHIPVIFCGVRRHRGTRRKGIHWPVTSAPWTQDRRPQPALALSNNPSNTIMRIYFSAL